MPILTKGQKKSTKAFLERKADKLITPKAFLSELWHERLKNLEHASRIFPHEIFDKHIDK